MKRRLLLRTFAHLPLLAATKAAWAAARMRRRARPGDRDWPNPLDWDRLQRDVGGRLVKVRSPLADCRDAPAGTACARLFTELRNPYYIGDEPGLAQTLGWVDAWSFAPSVYAVAAEQTSDVAAAVRFDNWVSCRRRGRRPPDHGRATADTWRSPECHDWPPRAPAIPACALAVTSGVPSVSRERRHARCRPRAPRLPRCDRPPTARASLP